MRFWDLNEVIEANEWLDIVADEEYFSTKKMMNAAGRS